MYLTISRAYGNDNKYIKAYLSYEIDTNYFYLNDEIHCHVIDIVAKIKAPDLRRFQDTSKYVQRINVDNNRYRQ